MLSSHSDPFTLRQLRRNSLSRLAAGSLATLRGLDVHVAVEVSEHLLLALLHGEAVVEVLPVPDQEVQALEADVVRVRQPGALLEPGDKRSSAGQVAARSMRNTSGPYMKVHEMPR